MQVTLLSHFVGNGDKGVPEHCPSLPKTLNKPINDEIFHYAPLRSAAMATALVSTYIPTRKMTNAIDVKQTWSSESTQPRWISTSISSRSRGLTTKRSAACQ
jgi:hypothetical protein